VEGDEEGYEFLFCFLFRMLFVSFFSGFFGSWMGYLIDLLNFFLVRDGKGFSSDDFSAAGGMGWEDFDDFLLIRWRVVGFDEFLFSVEWWWRF
jgi:hypothetical protein